jgi:hypothetical protein
MVLGRVGDSGTIPDLQQLTARETDRRVLRYADRALHRIGVAEGSP